MSDELQKLATDKGFNQDNDYASQDTGMTGADYLAAQIKANSDDVVNQLRNLFNVNL
ncbi:MAG: hypothetical protein K6E91_02950 [Butyrivibrio sp.]|nr:hypothetical protein [Butyrivibrio sp.]